MELMRLMVNGETRELPDGSPVTALLETLQVAPERVVVEVNLKILKRAELASTVLQAGDQVEIVHFVGGGSCLMSDVSCLMSNVHHG